jgi:hypothetical protein
MLQAVNYRCQQAGCESSHFLQAGHIVPVRLDGNQNLNYKRDRLPRNWSISNVRSSVTNLSKITKEKS